MSTERPEPASPACLAHEADDAYMGYATKDEIGAFLDELRTAGPDQAVRRLREMMPRVRDDALHRDLAAMLARLEGSAG